jgi:hypothetical protein
MLARPACALSQLIQAQKDLLQATLVGGLERSDIKQGRKLARPACAPSQLIQAQKDLLQATLVRGLERSDRN